MSANILKSLDEKELVRRKIEAIRQGWTPEEKMERERAGRAATLFLLALADDAEHNASIRFSRKAK